MKEEDRLSNEVLFGMMIDTLQKFHDSSYLHRDIKPESFRITADGKVKLIDFGLSRKYIND